ncbi:carbon-nitrogen hydrolase family protein [Pararhizobium haloflavum]|uniref:carbon-nitrogen hydrolase family protein n=1 Tax=Pararhizobium haloflavum TaxID=2037914 RepID=UPI000C19B1C5|nr:carbon-nitrogen hydrolase family protein [Pararhizobium haloflavum]
MTKFTAAVVQLRSGVSPDANVDRLRDLVAEAAARGATYVQTPEMTGAVQKNRAQLRAVLSEEETDLTVRVASELAVEHGIFLHIGSTAVALDDERIANRAFLFGPDGAIIARYDKIHMFDVDLDNGESWRESAVYRPGDCAPVVDLSFAHLGLGICYDIRFPQLYRAQALAGADILTAPAAFTRQTGEAHWQVLQRARAIENGAFVISAAQGGQHEDGRETYGHSMIVDPWGRVLAEIDHDEPAVAVAEIDVAAVAAARSKIPNLKNAREFTIDHVDGVADDRRRA